MAPSGVAVVEWIERRPGDREVRGSNPALAAVFFRGNREIREKSFFFTLQGCQYRTIASDFEEHLGQGLGVSCPLCIEIWIVAVYCEEKTSCGIIRCNMFYNCCHTMSKCAK